MYQLGDFVSEDLLGLVDLSSLESGESVDLLHRQECQHAQACVDVSVVHVSPVLEEVVNRSLFLVEPECSAYGLAHLLPVALEEQRNCQSEYFVSAQLSCEVYTADDVGPLVVSAQLSHQTEVSVHDIEVIALKEHV